MTKTFKIPIFSLPDKPLAAASQDLVPVAEVTADNIVLFKTGGACIIMESTSLNFGLLSEREQEAVIAAYSAMLNSLSFAIQIVVKSQKKDITKYLTYLEDARAKLQNPLLASIMSGYQTFLNETIKKKNVLSKKFYIVVPFSPLELGISKSLFAATNASGPLPYPKSYIWKKVKTVLEPKRDHLIRQAGRLGIKLRQVSRAEIVNLYFNYFNPEPPQEAEDAIVT